MAGALVLAADPEPLLARRGRAEALDLIPALRDPRLYLDGLSAPDGALTSDELARLSNLRPPDERALPDALRPPGDLTRPGGSVRLDGLARSDVPAPHGGLAQVDHLGQTGDEGEPGPASPAVAVEPPVRADAGKRTWTVLSALAERARPALGGHCDRLRTALMGLDRPRRPE